MNEAFEIKELRKSYGQNVVLDISAAEFQAGEITALVGPNGSGKTTLLECLCGLQRADSGRMSYFGSTLGRSAASEMTLVFQSPYLFNASVEYNVSYGLRLRGVRERRAAVDAALETVGLAGFNDRHAKKLSGGEAKRVAIARAIAFSPKTLLLDEPSANVDAEHGAAVDAALREMNSERGTTVIFATHSREQAVRLAHRIFLLHGGGLVPFHPDNHFNSVLEDAPGGRELVLDNGVRVAVSTKKTPGRVSCTISPDNIIVSRMPLDSSARNCLRGPVTAIALEDGRVRITADVGVRMTAIVTKNSYDDIRPAAGEDICLTFKASSIEVF